MYHNKGFTFIEVMISLAFLLVILSSFTWVVMKIGDDFQQTKIEEKEEGKFLRIEQQIKEDYKRHKVISIDGTAGVVFNLANGNKISYSPSGSHLIYETVSARKVYPYVSVSYDSTTNTVTVTGEVIVKTFLLEK